MNSINEEGTMYTKRYSVYGVLSCRIWEWYIANFKSIREGITRSKLAVKYNKINVTES